MHVVQGLELFSLQQVADLPGNRMACPKLEEAYLIR